MGNFSTTLPPAIAFVAMLFAASQLLRNAGSAPWSALAAPGVFSGWCMFIIALPLLWQFDVPVSAGFGLHLLGMPLFVLMFGRQLAMIGLGISVIAFTAIHDGLWANLGLNLLLLAVVPAYCGEIVMRITRRYFPHHLFVYLLGNGFFGALAMLAATGAVSLGARYFLPGMPPVSGDVVAFMLLLAGGESFLTGFLLTMFTVYRPQWVLTFDDEVYLLN